MTNCVGIARTEEWSDYPIQAIGLLLNDEPSIKFKTIHIFENNDDDIPQKKYFGNIKILLNTNEIIRPEEIIIKTSNGLHTDKFYEDLRQIRTNQADRWKSTIQKLMYYVNSGIISKFDRFKPITCTKVVTKVAVEANKWYKRNEEYSIAKMTLYKNYEKLLYMKRSLSIEMNDGKKENKEKEEEDEEEEEEEQQQKLHQEKRDEDYNSFASSISNKESILNVDNIEEKNTVIKNNDKKPNNIPFRCRRMQNFENKIINPSLPSKDNDDINDITKASSSISDKESTVIKNDDEKPYNIPSRYRRIQK